MLKRAHFIKDTPKGPNITAKGGKVRSVKGAGIEIQRDDLCLIHLKVQASITDNFIYFLGGNLSGLGCMHSKNSRRGNQYRLPAVATNKRVSSIKGRCHTFTSLGNH